MLDLRPECERCMRPLAPNGGDARICTYECTFCAHCAEQLGGTCPNCRGELVVRPRPPHPDAALVDLDAAFDGLQARVGEVGARQNQADAVKGGLAALESTLSQQKSELSEVDAERAITEMLARQTAYQAAMLASSKVMGMSLTDYLR